MSRPRCITDTVTVTGSKSNSMHVGMLHEAYVLYGACRGTGLGRIELSLPVHMFGQLGLRPQLFRTRIMSLAAPRLRSRVIGGSWHACLLATINSRSVFLVPGNPMHAACSVEAHGDYGVAPRLVAKFALDRKGFDIQVIPSRHAVHSLARL
ncbi:uncharacterized protein EI90DRAFT_3048036, partial [Cantharellus anzutake]|uniref:uncharacterized protein n=1 Tax=Cantharellus anzutake TaxID=1750568 RepID=UPI001908059B